jgi:hypothetical protein
VVRQILQTIGQLPGEGPRILAQDNNIEKLFFQRQILFQLDHEW